MAGVGEAPPHRGYIDVSARFGPEHGRSHGTPLTALLAEQRSHGIRLSVAHSRVAVDFAAETGNRAALDVATDRANRVAALAVVDASVSSGAAAAIREWASAGAAGFWLESHEAQVGLDAETGAARLRAIAATGRPLFIPIGSSVQTPAAVSAIGRVTAPLGIPVILVGVHYSNATEALEAAQRYDNLHVETSGMAHLAAVETAVARIGHERVLFGTGGPARAHQAPLNAVLLAELTNDAKRAILGGNAARLLGLPSGEIDLTPPVLPRDAFDVHTHYMAASAYDVPGVANADLLSRLAGWGTTSTVSSSFNAFASDLVEGNRETVHASGTPAVPGQGGLLVMNPADVEASADLLARWGDAPGIRGAKIHAWYAGVPTADGRMAELFRLLAGRRMPVKIHNDGPGWDAALGSYARAYPDLRILIAHAGLGTPSAEAARLAADHEHVYIEFASSFASVASMREAVRIAGPGKVAWGTDAPLLDPRFVLGSYMDAGLGPEAAPGVYRENGSRIFGAR